MGVGPHWRKGTFMKFKRATIGLTVVASVLSTVFIANTFTPAGAASSLCCDDWRSISSVQPTLDT